MDVMGLLILLLPALSSPSLAASREYRFFNELKTWSEAQSYCREKAMDLATMESEDDWAKLKETHTNSDSPNRCVWFGLYEDVNSWRWSRDNSPLHGDGNTLGSWFVFTPDNAGGRQSCAHTVHQQLGDANCQTSFWSVCYHEPTNSFVEVKIAQSWHSAQSYCRAKHTDLASVSTQQEWDALFNITGSRQLWIGLSRETWKWSDQSDCSFRKWDAGEPALSNGDCGCVHLSGWHDDYCTTPRPFICSAPINKMSQKMSKVVLKAHTSLEPNDPQVQEAALRQVEKELRDQGVHQPFTLSWRKQPGGKVFNKTEL